MAVTNYYVVEADNAAALALKVLEKIAESATWQPYGPAVLTSEGTLVQPMTVGAPAQSTTTDTVDAITYKGDGVTLSKFKWVTVTCTAALLDGAGTVPVIVGGTGDQYKIREIRLIGGGTNFGAGGDRLLDLTDGTTVWTTIANADLESAPSATLAWGNAKVPFLTGTSDTASTAASTIRFQYSGGTTDHTTGSIKFDVLLEQTAT